jgi:LuxR family maltose regulon positive regulatory protein
LAQEVLNRQPDEVRRFLLRSSILETFCGPLCEAVVEPGALAGYGTRMLDRLHHANLFVTPLDEQHDWFRYHRLFADFLLYVETETNATEITELHRRAAGWFEAHGRLDEACQHALATGDADWAADLIERNARALINAGELLTLIHWLGRLPAALVRQRPELSLAYAWGLILAYQLDEARLWLDDAEQSLGSFEEQPGHAAPIDAAEDTRMRKLRGGLAICRSTLAMFSGDVQQAVGMLHAALGDLPEDDPFSHSLAAFDQAIYAVTLGDTSQAIEALRAAARIARQANNLLVRVLVTCQLAEMQAMQGQLSQALATLQRAHFITLGPDGHPLPLAGIVDNALGEILRERDMLKEAREHLERGRRVAQAWWSLSSLDSMLSLARLLQSQGDVAGSQALITEASRLALSTESSQWDDVFVAAFAVRLALQRDDLAGATQWWQKSGLLETPAALSRDNYPYIVFEYLLLTQARLHFAIGQDTGDERELRRALDRLRALLPDVERFRRVTSKIEILILQAMTQYELGEIEQAVQALLSALALGETEDYRRIFLDEGRVMAELLARCQSAQPAFGGYLPSRRYLAGLLEVCRREAGLSARETLASGSDPLRPPATQRQPIDSTAFGPTDGLAVALSAREVEVLGLIAEGRSNQEISVQLCLALNTVKRHVYNIFAKLDAKNRTQAVSRARHLGLLP